MGEEIKADSEALSRVQSQYDGAGDALEALDGGDVEVFLVVG